MERVDKIPYWAIAVNDVAKMVGVRNCALFEFLRRKKIKPYLIFGTQLYVIDGIKFAPHFNDFCRYVTRLRSDRRITKGAFLAEYKGRDLPRFIDTVSVELKISDNRGHYIKYVSVCEMYKIHNYKDGSIRLYKWERERGWWTCLYSPHKGASEKSRNIWAGKFNFSWAQELRENKCLEKK